MVYFKKICVYPCDLYDLRSIYLLLCKIVIY